MDEGSRSIPEQAGGGSLTAQFLEGEKQDLPPRKHLPFLKAPNKLKYNQNLEELESVISKHEGTKSELLDSLRRSRDSQRVFREERDNINQRKNSVFHQLDLLNEEARKKNDIVTKLRGGIPHLRQEDIDAQIRKLEYQINKVNFKLTEEKRIVSEIDRLRRSKKNLKEYNTLKEELDKLRTQQHSLRIERDAIFQDLRELKRKEEDIRQRIKDLNSQLDQTRADIDHYRDEKYGLTAKFREQENDFRQRLRQRKEEQRRRDAEDQAASQAQLLKEQALYEANKVPYDHEIFLCNLLIRYTQALVSGKVGGGSLNNSTAPPPPHLLSLPCPIERRRSSGFSAMSDGSSHYATPMGCTPVGTPLEGSPPSSFDENSPAKGYYKKKEENEVFYNKSTKKSGKKMRTERKQQSSKKLLAHNPETFAQFAELNMFPPTQAGEVPASLDNIKEKLTFYQNKSDEELRNKNNKEIEFVESEIAPSIQIVVDPVQIIVEDSDVVNSIEGKDTVDQKDSPFQENSADKENNADEEISTEHDQIKDQINTAEQENSVILLNNEKDVISSELIEDSNQANNKINLENNESNEKAHLTLNLQKFTLQEISSCQIRNGGSSNGLKVNGDASNTFYDAALCAEEESEAAVPKQKTEKCGDEEEDSEDNTLTTTTVSLQPQDIHPSIV